jgi:predicted DCC family thiol-disulfide oxidoreductase YuxK
VTAARKPTLLYDGDCGFCRRWIERWREITGQRVTYATSRDAGHRFPEVDPSLYPDSVVFVGSDGAVAVGAEAVFRTLAEAPGWWWPLWLYRRLPRLAALTERSYVLVARRRTDFSRFTRWLWGDNLRLPQYHLVRWCFLRGLGGIYFIAFLSFWVQVDGLVGSQGIQPAQAWLAAVHERFGRAAIWQAPTLFWFNASDAALWLAGLAGMAASSALVANRAPWLAAAACWVLYASYYAVGGVFLSFQWDILLLETGFLALLLAPRQLRPRLDIEPIVPRAGIFLLRWLLFRLMLLSGVVKLASGDPSWWDLSALTFHYETQPLPTWIAWYVHNVPVSVHRVSCAVMFAIEVGLPFFIWAPRRLRLLAAAGFVALQLAIMATGNYTFFNLLTLLLCVTLLDDAYLARFAPLTFLRALDLRAIRPTLRSSAVGTAALGVTALLLVMLGAATAKARLSGSASLSRPTRAIVSALAPLHLSHAYGLFAVMTKDRREIVIEGSDDGREWKPYEFRWKPGDPAARPRFCQPHQPRLDWQMWFAALGSYRTNPWVVAMMDRLLEGSRPVLDLFGNNPFPDRPPRYVRAVIYEYRFTTIPGGRAEGTWWRRGPARPYAPVRTARAG